MKFAYKIITGYYLCITHTIGSIVSLLFYEDHFIIKYPTKFEMPLNKETKPNQWVLQFRYLVIRDQE